MPFSTPSLKPELAQLLHRLLRLIQEIGDRGLEPAAFAPTAYLRPHYLRLTRQAERLVQTMGFGECEATAYIGSLLVEQLRVSNQAERRQRMTLQEALGE